MKFVGFWLSPSVQAVSTMSSLKPAKKKKAPKTGKPSGIITYVYWIILVCSNITKQYVKW